jgi:hypothetical protein
MTSSSKTPFTFKRSSSKENRPIRVYAAILVLVVLIAGILYFTRETPIPKEIRDAVSTGSNSDSVWTWNRSDPNSISLRTPEDNTFRLVKTGDGISSFTVNGKAMTSAQQIDKYQKEVAIMLLELRKRNSANSIEQ